VNSKFVIALAIAFVLDLADWLIVGLIPIAGDLADVAGILILLPLIGPMALLGIVEFIPVLGDLSPSFLVAVFLSRVNLLGKTEEGEA